MVIESQGEMVRVGAFESLGAADVTLFFSAVSRALSSGVRWLEIDLTKTEYCDCSGIGALVALRRDCQRRNRGLVVRLVHASSRVRRLLELTGTDELFGLETEPALTPRFEAAVDPRPLGANTP